MKAQIAALAVFIAAALAQPSGEIGLVIRADDMGLTRGVNRGIVKGHKEGIVTSASLMPPTAYFDEAVALCRQNPRLAPGMHITLLATTPVRPVLPPEEVPSLVSADGFFFRSVAEFTAANPSIGDIEKEVRAQIRKSLATGLKWVYLDWHIAPEAGWPREDMNAMFLRLCGEHRLLCTQDPDGKHAGAVLMKAGLEGWGTQKLPDGTLVYYTQPGVPPERKARFLEALRNLRAGLWWQNVHPSTTNPMQAESTDFLCSEEVKSLIGSRGIRLMSYADLWQRKYGARRGPAR